MATDVLMKCGQIESVASSPHPARPGNSEGGGSMYRVLRRSPGKVIQARQGTGGSGKWGVALVGVVFGLLTLGAAYRFGLTVQGLVHLPTMVVLTLAALEDIQRGTIPDWLTLPGLVWVLGASVVPGLSRPADALIGAVACGGALLILAVLSPRSIGGGDVKLAAVVGASLGWPGGLYVLIVAQIAAAAVAICLLVTGQKGLRDAVAFGPFLAGSAILFIELNG